MATTYGYGGEFSSDEDIDKIEQRAEQIAQAKSGVFKPTRQQIEDFIRTMRKEPIDADDLDMPDDLLAGLLDYFKTQRGPIVDSTRSLYKKIVLKLIHGETQQQKTDQSNNGNNNNINNNNNNIVGMLAPRPRVIEFSSDEDDDPLVPKDASKKRFDPRVVDDKATSNGIEVVDENEDSMEIDSETPNGPPRNTKQVDISTTDDDDDETEESSTEERSSDDEDQELDNDALEVTPIKPSANQTSDMMRDGTATTPASKQLHSSVKRQQPLAHSTPKESIDSNKKPYTRSQRVAASRVTSMVKDNKSSADPKLASSSASVSSSSNRMSRKKYILLTVTLLMVLAAFGIYFIKPDLMIRPKNALKF